MADQLDELVRLQGPPPDLDPALDEHYNEQFLVDLGKKEEWIKTLYEVPRPVHGYTRTWYRCVTCGAPTAHDQKGIARILHIACDHVVGMISLVLDTRTDMERIEWFMEMYGMDSDTVIDLITC